MSAILFERLKKYTIQSAEDEKDALKEIFQEIILYGLADVNFFEKAVFQGGTSLRIFHNLNRFSEDLDFILKKPDRNFKWHSYLDAVARVCKQYGVILEIIDKSEADTVVKKMILKDNSIVKILNLSFKHHPQQNLTIKLEIDTNPPDGSTSEIQYINFPIIAGVEVQDLSSNLSGKSHALLCRKYVKGRDWYDFLWYYSKNISPNYLFLTNAINQTGPWHGQKINVTPEWYVEALAEKIKSIDWQQAVKDVSRFLNSNERNMLNLWNVDFFLQILKNFKKNLEKHK